LAYTKAGQDDIALWSIVPGIEGFPYYKTLQSFNNLCTRLDTSLGDMIQRGVRDNTREWQDEYMKLAEGIETLQKKINKGITDQKRHSLRSTGVVYHTFEADEDAGLSVDEGTVHKRRRRMMELLQNWITIENESWLASRRKAYEKQDVEKCEVYLLKLKELMDTQTYTVQDLFTPNSPQRTKMYFFPSFHPYPYPSFEHSDFGIPPVDILLDLMHQGHNGSDTGARPPYRPDRDCEGCKNVLETHLNLEALLREQNASVSLVFWGGLWRRWNAKHACNACRAVLYASSLLLDLTIPALSYDSFAERASVENIDLGKRFVLDFHYVMQELPYFANAYDDQSWYETYNRVYASVGKA
jgi:hypothetical protein